MDIFDILQKVMITFFVGSLLFAPIYAYIRHRISKKKSESGVDKRKIQYILQELVHTGEFFTVAYAYWYQMDYPGIGRSYTTSYWYYAIGFNENRIYIVPLMLEDGEIYYSSYSIVEKSMVKKVESESQYGKMKLFDQEGRLLAHLQVEDKNYSSFGSGDVDLYQKEEARAFRELVEKWTAEINDKGNSYNINQRCYTVKLTVIGNDEIAVIKAYRDITGIGIKEARDKIVTTPCVLIETTNWEEAELYKKKLEELGATIEISES